MATRVVLRTAARKDVSAAVEHYLRKGGESLALRFIVALEGSFDVLRRYPLSGPLRWAYELGIPDLRAWPVRRYPYAVFYVVRADQVDVWRVLHERRDVPPALTGHGKPAG